MESTQSIAPLPWSSLKLHCVPTCICVYYMIGLLNAPAVISSYIFVHPSTVLLNYYGNLQLISVFRHKLLTIFILLDFNYWNTWPLYPDIQVITNLWRICVLQFLFLIMKIHGTCGWNYLINECHSLVHRVDGQVIGFFEKSMIDSDCVTVTTLVGNCHW